MNTTVDARGLEGQERPATSAALSLLATQPKEPDLRVGRGEGGWEVGEGRISEKETESPA